MPLSPPIVSLIASVWEDGYPLVAATGGPDGPVIGPKGSMVVYDAGEPVRLAYWERTRGAPAVDP